MNRQDAEATKKNKNKYGTAKTPRRQEIQGFKFKKYEHAEHEPIFCLPGFFASRMINIGFILAPWRLGGSILFFIFALAPGGK